MSRTVFLALILIYAIFAINLAYDGLGPGKTASAFVVTRDNARPSIGVRWSGPGVKNQVTFTPAIPFLVLVGVGIPMGLGSVAMHYLRTTE